MALVSRGRAQQRALEITENKPDIGRLIKAIDRLKTQRNYEELIFTFDNLQEFELRDKYINLLLKRKLPFSEEFYFRGLQGRLDLLSQEKLADYFKYLEENEDWQDLASAYFRVGDKLRGTDYMCRHISRAIRNGNHFNAAYCFRSLGLNVKPEALFEISLEKSRQKNDIFWELRALQELGWTDELKAVLVEKGKEIEAIKDSMPYDMFASSSEAEEDS